MECAGSFVPSVSPTAVATKHFILSHWPRKQNKKKHSRPSNCLNFHQCTPRWAVNGQTKYSIALHTSAEWSNRALSVIFRVKGTCWRIHRNNNNQQTGKNVLREEIFLLIVLKRFIFQFCSFRFSLLSCVNWLDQLAGSSRRHSTFINGPFHVVPESNVVIIIMIIIIIFHYGRFFKSLLQ